VSDAQPLAVAVRALLPGTLTVHAGIAPPNTAPPWVVVSQAPPSVDTRAESGTPLGRVGDVDITVAAETEDGVLYLLDAVTAALDDATATVDGWATTLLRRIGQARVYADDPALPGGTSLMVGHVAYRYVTSTYPTEES
jgi:hypothetical protein